MKESADLFACFGQPIVKRHGCVRLLEVDRHAPLLKQGEVSGAVCKASCIPRLSTTIVLPWARSSSTSAG